MHEPCDVRASFERKVDTASDIRDFNNKRIPARIASDGGALALESEWRRPTQFPAPEDHMLRSYASRWVEKEPSFRNLQTTVTDHYTVALSMRRTAATLTQSGQKFHDGDIGSGLSHIIGPNEPLCANFRAANDFVHLFLTSSFLLRCGEEMEVRNSAMLPTVAPHFRRCLITERLLRSLIIIPVQERQINQLYIDGISIAIAAQLLILSQQHRLGSLKGGAQPLPKWRLRRVLEFIDGNLADSITLPSLADAAGLTRMHFAAQFRAATGLRPHEFVLRKRIEHAQDLLLKTNIALAEIAFDCGFHTQSHFTTVFKKIVGQTPKQWSDGNHPRAHIMLRPAECWNRANDSANAIASCNA